MRFAVGCEVLAGIIMLTEWCWRRHNDGYRGDGTIQSPPEVV